MNVQNARQMLRELEEERALAREHGLLADPTYRADLEDEIAACRELYKLASITEVAVMQGVLVGRLQG